MGEYIKRIYLHVTSSRYTYARTSFVCVTAVSCTIGEPKFSKPSSPRRAKGFSVNALARVALYNPWKDRWLEIRRKMLTERASGCPSCGTCFTTPEFSTLLLPLSAPSYQPLSSCCPSNLRGKELPGSWEIFYSCTRARETDVLYPLYPSKEVKVW